MKRYESYDLRPDGVASGVVYAFDETHPRTHLPMNSYRMTEQDVGEFWRRVDTLERKGDRARFKSSARHPTGDLLAGKPIREIMISRVH